ncbi:hypothetical protein [Actinocrispum wychmicini]|uniref:Uncharacterized protein n=1 Tax=Actinocrispum wychmicini TaxID=1213861 RepID=A0A4R2JRA9_9PSEU|nr:hypothetical protein [Actinocrispum wychmicini]TCO62793.1 hypothetical protein EV192_102932 [Actinocrispum wychmicini]
MAAIVYNLTTALLMVVMVNSGLALVGRDTITRRPIPWVAIALTGLVVIGVVLQLTWSGAMAALDNDPAKTGWWRVVTSVFMQNGGIVGSAWNIATIAIVAALAEWFWGGSITLALFLAGILLPHHIDSLLGIASVSSEPRNFAGSSGVTYFLAATLAVPLLVRTRVTKERLIAAGVVVLGLVMWFAQDNAHGLMAVYGFVLGAVVWAVRQASRRSAQTTRSDQK